MSIKINGEPGVRSSPETPEELEKTQEPGKGILGDEGTEIEAGPGINRLIKAPRKGQPQLPLPQLDVDPALASLMLMQMQGKLTAEAFKTADTDLQSKKKQLDALHQHQMAELKEFFKQQADAIAKSNKKSFWGSLFHAIGDIFTKGPAKGFEEIGEDLKDHPVTAILLAVSILDPDVGLLLLPFFVAQILTDPDVDDWITKTGIATKALDAVWDIGSVLSGHPEEVGDRQEETLKLKNWLESDAVQNFIRKYIADTIITIAKDLSPGKILDGMLGIQHSFLDDIDDKYGLNVFDALKSAGIDLSEDTIMDMIDAEIDQLGTKDGDTMLFTTGLSIAVTLPEMLAFAVASIAALFIPEVGPLVAAAIGIVGLCVGMAAGGMALESAVIQYQAAQAGSEMEQIQADQQKTDSVYQKQKSDMNVTIDRMKNLYDTMNKFTEDTMNIITQQSNAMKAALRESV